MKRELLYILAGGILLAACSRDADEPTRRELSFTTGLTDSTGAAPTNTPAARGTDGTPVTGAGLKTEGNTFAVYSEYSLGSQPVQTFDNQPQAVTYAGGGWTYAPKKAWVNSANYKFRAYYPSTAAVEGTTSSANLLTVEYNIARDNFDLLVAYAERYPAAEGYGAVTMPFKHALAALRFEIKYDDDVNTTDRVTKAYLRDICVVGLMTFGGTPSDRIVWYKSYSDTEPRYTWEGVKEFGAGNTRKATVYDGEGIVFAIPQAVGEKTTAFHFLTEAEGNTPHVAYIPAVTWEPGKVYTYTITLSGSALHVAVSIKEWKTIRSNADIYI
ncbi:fimbrillin family protein [Butyricimonas sp.]|uniref:fimbrillin family protein n=1 Tax=Butyricimonas sp. TaxID=1969738 RepID=UPI0025BF1D4C|nr:fimbrillin family protein [Butyricimonas sp.]